MGRTRADGRRGWAPAVVLTLLACCFALASPGLARADLRFHGSSAMADGSCAGCHRTYTAAGALSWRGTAGETLDVLPETTTGALSDFCYTCHGRAGTGAATNVYDGVYESDEHGARGARLNGGAFGDHVARGDHHPYDGCDSPACDSPDAVVMSCGTCHDFHGSSNYRLLRDVVNGVRVGGYVESVGGVRPRPYVISNEPGYPAGGWGTGAERETQMAAYDPDYCTPMYAKAPDGDPARGVSRWCSACHAGRHDAGTANVSGAGVTIDDVARDGHPVNVPLGSYRGSRPIRLAGLALPVAHDPGSTTPEATASDWMDCLTCHRAHGSGLGQPDASGLAWTGDAAPPSTSGLPDAEQMATGGALLRLGGVGLCEACHAM